jgi:hypothetical protein
MSPLWPALSSRKSHRNSASSWRSRRSPWTFSRAHSGEYVASSVRSWGHPSTNTREEGGASPQLREDLVGQMHGAALPGRRGLLLRPSHARGQPLLRFPKLGGAEIGGNGDEAGLGDPELRDRRGQNQAGPHLPENHAQAFHLLLRGKGDKAQFPGHSRKEEGPCAGGVREAGEGRERAGARREGAPLGPPSPPRKGASGRRTGTLAPWGRGPRKRGAYRGSPPSRGHGARCGWWRGSGGGGTRARSPGRRPGAGCGCSGPPPPRGSAPSGRSLAITSRKC